MCADATFRLLLGLRVSVDGLFRLASDAFETHSTIATLMIMLAVWTVVAPLVQAQSSLLPSANNRRLSSFVNSADSVKTASPADLRLQIRAIRYNGARPVIDGKLGDDVWGQSEVTAEFWQREPREGAPATERTEVRVLFDEEAIYVSSRMYSNHPEKIGADATRRDQLGYAETFLINLDPYHSRKTSYSFGVTAAGVKQDYYHPIDDEIKSRDVSYNPVWEAKTVIDSVGWTAEMRIPFSQVRFKDTKDQVWGVNFNRYIPSRNEDTYWRLRRNRDTGWSSLFGDLVGLGDIRGSRRIEVMPYGASSVSLTDPRNSENPFDNGTNLKGRIGADLKMGLGPNLTLDGTINPDFGQVEADPAVVNLTAFETIFTEQRPFFVEGNRLLSNTNPTYYYSRRIGAAPHGSASGSFVDIPTNSTILGAGKITGRLNSGLSLGALSAVTARENARTFNVASKATSSPQVEPLTSYNVVRLEQEFGPYVSTAGFTFTGVRRWFTDDSPLSNMLARQAFSGGGNWNLRFEKGMYEFGGDIGGSYIEGTGAAILRQQTSSARYFQRPDATYATLDSSKTSLSGYTGWLYFNKNGGDHWLGGSTLVVESPGFELNDIGRTTSADNMKISANVHYRETLPTSLFHSYDVGITFGSGWNFEKILQARTFSASAKVTWHNFWSTTITGSLTGRAQSSNLTRGGPLMGTGAAWNASASVSSGATSRTKMSAAVLYGADEFGGWTREVNGSFAPRPADQWMFSAAPRFVRSVNSRQYVAALTGGRTETYGKRYVFSFIEQSTLSIQVRFAYNFSPELSVEVYAEPFAASGRYYDYGELWAPRSLVVKKYGTEGTLLTQMADGSLAVKEGNKSFTLPNRDFNIRSFRSNVVLRWEWRLGSTLYIVWQENRASTTKEGGLVTPASLLETFSAAGSNILAIKLSYWLSPD